MSHTASWSSGASVRLSTSPGLADGNIVVSRTSADALAQSVIGAPVLSMRRRALEVTGVVEPDEVAHLVGQRVLEIVVRLSVAAQVGMQRPDRPS